jgi:type 2 lantibiotic biosynthesis protein LanM
MNDWYRALSLSERLRLERPRERAVDRGRGERRLARWQAQDPFADGEVFAQRLALDGLSRDGLAELLGEVEPGAEQEPPEWVSALHESFAPTARPPLPLRTGWEGAAGSQFWGFVELLVRPAFGRLSEAVGELVRAHPESPLRPETVEGLLLDSLPYELIIRPLGTLVLELNVARMQGELAGATAAERFEQFVLRLQKPEAAFALFAEYPVLARQMVEHVASWSRTTLELLDRLCRDWPLIAETFPGCDPADTLTRLQAGAGDRHRGGRAVAILSFRSGFKLVYKPRPLSVDARFQQLLATLNEWGDHPPFRTLAVLGRDGDRNGYGWMEHVAVAGCGSAEEARRFYLRQGGYLALLYMLRATDIHFENVVAAGEHPVIIDLESILSPGPPHDDPQAESFLTGSILLVGLLPIRSWENESSPGLDVSALGGLDGQLPPRPEPYWAEAGTDSMRLSRRVQEITIRGRHRPTLDGRSLAASDYTEEVVAGFENVYRLLLARREELFAEGGPLAGLAQEEVRVLLRPTSLYTLMLREGFHPDFLRDALDRDRFFDKLWVQVAYRPFLRRLVAAEQESLRRGDIPLFTAHADSTALRVDADTVLEDFFTAPALELARKRLDGFGERDLVRQVWFIRASLAILSTADPERDGARPARTSTVSTAIPRERLERLAARIGDHLLDRSIEEEDSIRWLGLVPTRQGAYKIAPVGENLYSGQAGVTLFLAYLGQAGGEARHVLAARKSCDTLLRALEEDSGLDSRAGAFDGLGGVIYTLLHLSCLWLEPALLDEALRLVDRLGETDEEQDGMDIVRGAAGGIAALSALHRTHPAESTLRAVRLCAERLARGAVPASPGSGWKTTGEAEVPMPGYSHGTSGIAAALFEAAALSGELRFREPALEALRYERSLFSAEHGNWADVRRGSERFNQVNWCHGAPGIGMARLLVARHEDTPEIQTEIETAVRTTLAGGFGRNHSLCHGDLGNLDLLLLANTARPDLRLQPEIDRLTAEIVEDIETSGWRCGLPMDVETPGLMVGLAGIGYGLLRLAAPERVPSVLTLEPPRQPAPS